MVSIFGFTYHCEPKKKDTMKKPYEILSIIRKEIQSEEFKFFCRVNPQDFTRNCLVTIPLLIALILNLIKRSLQVELLESEKILNLPPISKQTFSAARQKLHPNAFKMMNSILVREYYTNNNFKTFHGYRFIGVDGSTLQLVESASIKEKYGTSKNQTGENSIPLTRISYAYDLLSGITIDAIIRPYDISERFMTHEHLKNIQSPLDTKDLYIFDRGYPSITLICSLLYHKKDFLMRCKKDWLKETSLLVKRKKKDTIIEISPKKLYGDKRKEFIKLLPNVPLDKKIKIRVLLIPLPTGEIEILITSLLDKKEHPYSVFSFIYNKRWRCEENFKLHKVSHEIENFSGTTDIAIQQEILGTIFTANVRALIADQAQMEIEEEYSKKHLKYAYKINSNISIGILKNELLKVIFDPNICLKSFCERLKNNMKRSVIPIRNQRKYRRIKKSSLRKKYHPNKRRAI